MNIDSGRLDNVHGDEDEIAAEARKCAEEWEAEQADNWKNEGYEHE